MSGLFFSGQDCSVGCGACCEVSAACNIQPAQTCLPERFQGVGVTCAEVSCAGACCQLDGTCTEGPQTGCLAFRGFNTTCSGAPCPEHFDEASAWLTAIGRQPDLAAFDEFYPVTGSGCQVPNWPAPPTVPLGLPGGAVELTVLDEAGSLQCPVEKFSGFTDSDLRLHSCSGFGCVSSTVFVEFDPPASAFFMFVHEHDDDPTDELRVSLIDSGGNVVAVHDIRASTNQLAIGYGFVSDAPIVRAEIRHQTPVGAADKWIGTAPGINIGESSLGQVFIPEYGFEVEYDFGVVWADATPVGCPGDLNKDGLVDTVDFLELLAAWGACP